MTQTGTQNRRSALKASKRLPSRIALASMVLAGIIAGGTPAAQAVNPPAGYPIFGLDVSAFQGAVNWDPVVANGALFAYVRAGEQNNISDAQFTTNYQGARDHGLFTGAYWRARPDVSGGRDQANNLLDRAQYVRDGRTLPPMLDIEWPRSTWTGLNSCYNMTPAQMVGWIRDFVDQVTARTGQRATIYTNPNWWGPCTGNNAGFGAHPLYNSGYLPNPPPTPAGWATWTFWQYDDEGIFPGGQDVFNGDYTALQRLAGGVPAPISLRANVNNRFVVAENRGALPLIANRTAVGAWEQFHLVDAGGGYVALRSNVNGRYVTAEDGGSSALIANRVAIGSWERFQVVNNPDGTISIRANANGRYVTAENAGSSPLIANRTAIDLWEKFTQVGPSPISLRADVNSRYVAAENAGALPLIANRTAVGLWEQFSVIDAGNGFVALRSNANGRYVAAENGGADPLIANRTTVGPWEKFQFIHNPDGSLSIRAGASGRYVAAENAGTSPLIANRTAIGLWERFRLTGG
jgi:GH25 family lysozyme M1 (1,4-beta-N-acetylmuramidase)